MSIQANLTKRRGGGGSSGGGGRSSSSSSSGGSSSSSRSGSSMGSSSSAPKSAPAPAPISAPATPPAANSPPFTYSPAPIPADSDSSKSGKDKSGKDKSGKNYPSLPKFPKLPKPGHDNHYNQRPGNGYVNSSESTPEKSDGTDGKTIGIAIGAVIGGFILLVLICICCKSIQLAYAAAKTKKANRRYNRDLELGIQREFEKLNKPKRAFLKGTCIDRIVALRKQLGCANPTTRSKEVEQPSHQEEGLAAQNTRVGDSGSVIHEVAVLGTTANVQGTTSNEKPPTYVNEEGISHCKDPVNPCESSKVPHTCVEESCEKSDATTQETHCGKAM